MPPIKEELLPARVRKSLVGAYTRLGRDKYDADAWGEILKCAGVCDDSQLARDLRLDYLSTFPHDLDVWEDTVRAEIDNGDMEEAGNVLGQCLDINHSLQAQLLYLEYVHSLSSSSSATYPLSFKLAAHKYVLNESGYDINATPLWLSYLNLLKDRMKRQEEKKEEGERKRNILDSDILEAVLATYITALAQPLRDLDEIYEDYIDWVSGMDSKEVEDILPTFSVMCEEAEAVYHIAIRYSKQRTRLYEELPISHVIQPINIKVRSKNAIRGKMDYTLEENRIFPEIVQQLPESLERVFTNRQVFDAYVLESYILDEEEKKRVSPSDNSISTNSEQKIRSPIHLINEYGVRYELQDIPIPFFGSGTASMLHNKGFTTYERWLRTILVEEALNRQMKEEFNSLMSPYYQLTESLIENRLIGLYRSALVELRYWPGMWFRFIEYINAHSTNIGVDTTPSIHLTEEEKREMKKEEEMMERERDVKRNDILSTLTDRKGAFLDTLNIFNEAILAMPTCGLLHMGRLDYVISEYKRRKKSGNEEAINAQEKKLDPSSSSSSSSMFNITIDFIHNLIDEMINMIPSPLIISEAMFYYVTLGEYQNAYSLLNRVRRHPELSNSPAIDSKETVKEQGEETIVQTIKITEEERENVKPGLLTLYAPSDPTVSKTSVVPVKSDLLVHHSIFLSAAAIIRSDPMKSKRVRREEARELLEASLKLHPCYPSFAAECVKLLATNDNFEREKERRVIKREGEEEEEEDEEEERDIDTNIKIEEDIDNYEEEEKEKEPLQLLKEHILSPSSPSEGHPISRDALEEVFNKAASLSQLTDRTRSLEHLASSSPFYSSNLLYSTTMRHSRWGLSPISHAFLDAEMMIMIGEVPMIPNRRRNGYSQIPIRSFRIHQRAFNVTPLNTEALSVIYPEEGLIFINGEEGDVEGGDVGKLHITTTQVHPRRYMKEQGRRLRGNNIHYYNDANEGEGVDGSDYDDYDDDDIDDRYEYEEDYEDEYDDEGEDNDGDDGNNTRRMMMRRRRRRRRGRRNMRSGGYDDNNTSITDDDDDGYNRNNNNNKKKKKRLALPTNTPAILAALVSVLPRTLDIKQMRLPLREEFVEALISFPLQKHEETETPLDFLYSPMPFVPDEETALLLMRGVAREEKEKGARREGAEKGVKGGASDPRAYDPRMERGEIL